MKILYYKENNIIIAIIMTKNSDNDNDSDNYDEMNNDSDTKKKIVLTNIKYIISKANQEFLVDKYMPRCLEDVLEEQEETKIKNIVNNRKYFHREILYKLREISKDDSIPHIIFYGNKGSGKKTLINLFLELIFDKSIYKLDDSKYSVKGSGNNESIITVKQSDHHIIIEPTNTNFDRYLIQDIVKEYAKKYPLCIFDKNRNFKTVQINNLDNLSYYAQTSLRRTMEKYSKTCRFVSWCYSLSKVIEPLRSRCLCVHVPSIKREELIEWLYMICMNERIEYKMKIMDEILDKSDGNIKDILWRVELYNKFGRINNEYHRMIDLLIREINNSILDVISVKCIKEINKQLYNFKKKLTTEQKEKIKIEDLNSEIKSRINEYIEKYSDRENIIYNNVIKDIKYGNIGLINDNNVQTKRDYIYKILITNVSQNTIIKDILNRLLILYRNIDKMKILEIIRSANKYDYRLSKCRRERIHIECFIENVINIIIT